jgi:heme-degrading monooxygenase HmoA
MYSSTFIFAKKQFDDEFNALDRVISEVARSIDGYLGEEAWENSSTGLISNVYYWETLEALHQLIQNPSHLKAKANQAQWLNGYRVVISEVRSEYGEKGLGMV